MLRDKYRQAEPESKPKRPLKGRAGQNTKLSYACKNNKHNECFAKACECPCGHPPIK